MHKFWCDKLDLPTCLDTPTNEFPCNWNWFSFENYAVPSGIATLKKDFHIVVIKISILHQIKKEFFSHIEYLTH